MKRRKQHWFRQMIAALAVIIAILVAVMLLPSVSYAQQIPNANQPTDFLTEFEPLPQVQWTITASRDHPIYFDSTALELSNQLTEQAWQLPHALSVVSLNNLVIFHDENDGFLTADDINQDFLKYISYDDIQERVKLSTTLYPAMPYFAEKQTLYVYLTLSPHAASMGSGKQYYSSIQLALNKLTQDMAAKLPNGYTISINAQPKYLAPPSQNLPAQAAQTRQQQLLFTFANKAAVNPKQTDLALPRNSIIDIPLILEIAAFVQWCRTQPEVWTAHSILDELRMTLTALELPTRTIDSTDTVMAALTLYQMNLPMGMGVSYYRKINASNSKVTVQVILNPGVDALAFNREASQWLQANTSKLHAFTDDATLAGKVIPFPAP